MFSISDETGGAGFGFADFGATEITPDYAASFSTIAPGFTEQITAQTGPSAEEPWWQVAMRTLSTVVVTDYQRRLLNIQLDRARQGLPPLNTSQYGVGVQVGMDPNVQKMLIIGGVGLFALLMLMRRGR